MKKKKLELKKKVIAALSDVQKAKIMGGDDAAYTTSYTNCTHFICCGDGCSIDPNNCPGDSNETCTCNSCIVGCATTECPSGAVPTCDSLCC